MQQYGTTRTNYTAGTGLDRFMGTWYWSDRITVEAALGIETVRPWRGAGAKEWYKKQTRSVGMPWCFHCRG